MSHVCASRHLCRSECGVPPAEAARTDERSRLATRRPGVTGRAGNKPPRRCGHQPQTRVALGGRRAARPRSRLASAGWRGRCIRAVQLRRAVTAAAGAAFVTCRCYRTAPRRSTTSALDVPVSLAVAVAVPVAGLPGGSCAERAGRDAQ
jgi:hypothetical protein